MRFDLVFSKLKTLVEDLAGRGELLLQPFEDTAVFGAEQSALVAATETQAKITVRCVRIAENGNPEKRQIFDPAINLFRNFLFGNRILTFRISGMCYDQSDDATIFPLLENVRSRLQSPSGLSAIRDFQCSFASTSPVEAEGLVNDDGAVSAASFMLLLNAGVYYEDANNTTIDTVTTPTATVLP